MTMKSVYVCFLFTIILGTTNVNGQTTISNEVKSLIKKKIEYNKNNGYGFRSQRLLFLGKRLYYKHKKRS
mgnify:CR=1 FL=1